MRRFLLCVPLLCAAALPLSAQNAFVSFFKGLDYSVAGSLLLFPESNGNASAAMPILPSLGGAASYSFSELVALEMTLDIYMNVYDYSYKLGRAVPADIEDRSSFVIGNILGFQPVFRFRPAGDKFTIRAYGGLALDLRICVLAYGLDSDEPHGDDEGKTVSDAASDVFSYFWGNGRFVFPYVGYGMDFAFFEGLTLGFDLRAWFPVWRAWTGEDSGADGFRVGIGFRATFK